MPPLKDNVALWAWVLLITSISGGLFYTIVAHGSSSPPEVSSFQVSETSSVQISTDPLPPIAIFKPEKCNAVQTWYGKKDSYENGFRDNFDNFDIAEKAFVKMMKNDWTPECRTEAFRKILENDCDGYDYISNMILSATPSQEKPVLKKQFSVQLKVCRDQELADRKRLEAEERRIEAQNRKDKETERRVQACINSGKDKDQCTWENFGLVECLKREARAQCNMEWNVIHDLANTLE